MTDQVSSKEQLLERVDESFRRINAMSEERRTQREQAPSKERIHELKCWPKWYAAVKSGEKPFEMRVNDRDYQVGDVLWLREWKPASMEYTGDEIRRVVTFVLRGDDQPFLGLDPSYCIMGLAHEPRATRRGCEDLDPNWPNALGEPRGPTLCVLYPKCKCGEKDERASQPPLPDVNPMGRDSDWVLAIGHALGLDSGFKVPIVPRPEPFRELFEEVRRRASQPPTPDDARDASRWRALIGCARVRVLGCAGLNDPASEYAHIGVELWTRHPAQSLPESIETLTAFADRAVLTKESAPNTVWWCDHGSPHHESVYMSLCGCKRPTAGEGA